VITAEARGAWRELESRLRPYLARRMASAADIDDSLQEIFVKLHQSVDGLRDEERFGGWVYRIAQSVVVDHARARARGPTLTPLGDDHASSSGEEDTAELRAALGECVALFVAKLDSPYREAVTLTELEGLSQKEAAERLGISLSGMKSRVQRGREKVRDLFEDCCRVFVDARGSVAECEPRLSARAASGASTGCGATSGCSGGAHRN